MSETFQTKVRKSFAAAGPKSSDGLLYGGFRDETGRICPQRLTYVLLHALTARSRVKDDYDTLSQATLNERLTKQADLAEHVVREWFPETQAAMLGGDGGTRCRYELAMKKPMRVLSRLRDKKLYAKSFFELGKLMDDYYGTLLVTSFSLYLDFAAGIMMSTDDFEISDDIWLSAIELTMILSNANAYFDPNNDAQWVRDIEQNKELLWVLVYYIAICSYYSMFCMDNHEMLAMLAYHEAAVDVLQAENQKLSRDCDKLSQRAQETDADKDALISRLNKEIARLEHENASLHARLDDFDDDVSSTVAGDSEATDVAESGADFCEPAVLHELPSENVLFVGGHPNMLSKLRPLYPGWTFVSTETWTKALASDLRPVYVFMWTNHMSHPLSDRVRTQFKNVPMGYLTATNLDRLQFEMTKSYSDFVNSQA